MEQLKGFFASFLSRKFMLAVGGAVTCLATKQYEAAAGIVGAYILAEAHIDAKAAGATATGVIDAIEREAAKG